MERGKQWTGEEEERVARNESVSQNNYDAFNCPLGTIIQLQHPVIFAIASDRSTGVARLQPFTVSCVITAEITGVHTISLH